MYISTEERNSKGKNEDIRNNSGISPVVQWLRIHLPTQGTRDRSLVWGTKIPHAAKQRSRRALQAKSQARESSLHKEGSHIMHEDPAATAKTRCSQIHKQVHKYIQNF